MKIQEQIKNHIDSLPESKRNEMLELHILIQKISESCSLWFFDGKNEDDKVVANPTIGYGNHTINYANGTSKDVFKIGLSANKSGISIHILGIKDKTFLVNTFGDKIGKATISGYCIKFRSIKNINLEVIEQIIKFAFENND